MNPPKPRTDTGAYKNIDGLKMTSSGALSNLGQITAPSFNATSDRRLKRDIKPLENSLNKITQLEGVEFIRTDDKKQEKQIGFIAQEVEKIVPEVVSTDYSDSNEYKSVAYSNVTALLVEAIKELRQEVKDLKEEIRELKSI